ncbi:MAG: hypothetical protein JWN48_5457 [Myxococcaceae bacterium]|nr:hypothetical protein [Myxococcaceae bacterium]
MRALEDVALGYTQSRAQRTATPYVATSTQSRTTPRNLNAGEVRVLGVTPTGYGTSECSLSIAKDGTIFFGPAFSPAGNGILRSRDQGHSFEQLIPRFPNGKRHGREQAFMYLDPVTERLFFHTSVMRFKPPNFGAGFHQSRSDDHGQTWQYCRVGEDARDWAKVYAGRPVYSKPSAYHNRVLYLSAPSPISTRCWPWLRPKYQTVHKSLDGGASWKRVGKLSLDPSDVPNCSRWEWVIMGNGVVAEDGTVFIGLRRGPRFAVAVSRDEGATWDVDDVPGAHLLSYFNILQVGLVNGNYVIGEALALDQAGNLFAVWPDQYDLLRLSVSRDQGRSWSKPVVCSAPGVTHVRYGAIAARGTGQVAIAYYGSKDGRAYDGYLAETRDALQPEPTFWSGTVNESDDPLYARGFNPGYVPDMFLGGDLNEFMQVKYAPNGDVFASFCKQMENGSGPAGWSYRAHAGSKLQGMLGRMVHV